MLVAQSYRLRPALLQDAEAIGLIYAPIVRDTIISFELEAPGPEEMARRIQSVQQTHAWLVAVDRSDKVCAYAYAGAHRSRQAYQWSCEVSVYVDQQHRRRGLAAALYAGLEDCLRVQGFHRAFAGVALPNPASCTFHRRCGYSSIGTFPDVGYKAGRWISTEWFSKVLLQSRAEAAANPGIAGTAVMPTVGLKALQQGGADMSKLLARAQLLLDGLQNEQ